MTRLLWLGVIALAAIDWAALDDITTGHEPSLTAEYLTLAFSVPIIGFLIRSIGRQKARLK